MHPILCTSQDELQFFSSTNLACSMLSSVPVDASNCAKLIHTWKEKWGNREMKAPHSSPQLPHRSPQYSRWRLNTGEFTTGLFSVGSGNTPSLKLYFTNTLSYAKLKKHYASDLTGGANIALGTSPRLSLRAFDSPSRRFPTKCTFVRVRFWTRF